MTTNTAAPGTKRLYFGYGSNLWIDQMNRRCPENKLIGLGILRGWKWNINCRGYANIIGSPGDLVYGLVYEISPSDEARLDEWEEVPLKYTKHVVRIELQSKNNEEGSVIQSLAYIDERSTEEGEPREEYVHRINKGVKDAVARGLPKWYIDKYIRRFIPAGEGEQAVEAFKPKEVLRNAATTVKPNM